MKYSATFCKSNKKTYILFTVAALLFLTAAAFGVLFGSTKVNIAAFINALMNGHTTPDGRIIMFVRLPRTLGCLTVGAGLSVAGAIIQNVLANRLASPGIIGINSGAGLAVTLCTAFGVLGGWKMALFAFLGALIAVMIITIGTQKFGSSRSTVILIGVSMNGFLNAVSDTVITFNPNIAIMSTDFKIGDFSSVTYQKLVPAIIITATAILIAYALSNELDVITLGDENATGLGLNTKLIRTVFLTLVALMAGSAVSIAGLISFIGLIIPHTIRLLGESRAKTLIPLCALFGGGFVCLCDVAARTLFTPYEIPVGIIMAFIGAPFFVFILIKGKGGHKNA